MTDRFVCSDASEQRAEPVTATASQVRGWLLVEVHGSWGIDAVAESDLGDHVPAGWKAELRSRGIRVICIRPPDRADWGDDVRLFFVRAGRPGRVEGAAWTRTAASLGEIADLTADLRLDAEPPEWDLHRERLVLVCTNGRHDQCCANRGRPVIRHLRTTRWADQVWECSHIGGDRFAANVVVLPDSLYFGRMEPADAERLLDDHARGQLALDWYRGRSTLRFVEQAAEHAVRAALGVRGVDDVVLTSTSGSDTIRADVAGIGLLDVAMDRTVHRLAEPLTCRGTPGQEVPHYTAVTIREAD